MKYTLTPTEGSLIIISSDNLLYSYENNLLLKEVEKRIKDGLNRFIIDLSGIKYMNSLGLSFMIAVLTKSRNVGGETVIANVSPKIAELLAVMKLKSIFTVCEDIEAAIDFFETENNMVQSV
jgi:anti-sigma B factor antagonist